LLRAGALDVLRADVAGWAERARAILERKAQMDALMASPMVQKNVAGESRRWRDTVRQVVELSQSDASVMLTGETGTGKELLASLLHGLDPRPHKAGLVVLDCTTLVAELSGSELFGHERGAFTGALTARDGVIAQAEGGTLFLDEIGELPLGLQAQLLRVIQERSYRRVGADNWRSSSFRLICATHRDLEVEVRAGRFRADLYHRLAASIVRLPALRERRSDVLPLARFFLAQLSGGRITEFDPLVEEHLLRREFPGNVRELKQLVGRAYHRAVGPGTLGYSALPAEEWGSSESGFELDFEPVIRKAVAARLGLKEIGRISRELAVKIALEDASGSLQRAASLLGVTDRALQLRKAQKLDA
ncbi:MAG TPA: sigma 54-interacting transcriptional regulator, partial [Polyangiaceae bacterium]